MSKFKNYQLEIVTTFVWLLVICLINPTGNFPLNDDWCYGKSVKTLYEINQLKLYNWGEMTLVGQVFWGYLFTKIFGFSFTVLRFSTLILALISFFGLLKIFKLIRIPKYLSLLGVFLCMFNPIFLELSFTFMTDVPFYTISVFVLYFFLKAIKTKKNKYVYFAFLCCALAFSIRQLAIIYPFSWFVFSIFTSKFSIKSIKKATLFFLGFLVFAFAFEFLLKWTDVMQERYNSKLHLLIQKLISFNRAQLVYSVCLFLTSLAYIGLFLSPLLLVKFKKLDKNFLKYFIPIYTIIAFLVLYRYDYILPSLDNIWIDFGVGPFTLYHEVAHFKQTPNPHLPKLVYCVLTLWGIICSAVLFKDVFILFNKKNSEFLLAHKEQLFALITALIYLAPFLIVGVYDRYLLPLLPLVIVYLFSNYRIILTKKVKVYTVSFLLVLAWFSVCAVHDYLSWNRSRWEIITYLTKKQNVPVNKINGGAEFITWYHFSETQDKWWENVTPVFVISAEKTNKDHVINAVKYSRWLPGKGILYLLYNENLDY